MDHLGIQVEEEGELTELRKRLKAADMPVVEEGETICCYARSDKSWVHDPAGIPWKLIGQWRRPSYSLVSLISPKVRVVHQKRRERLIAVYLLKTPSTAAADEHIFDRWTGVSADITGE